MTQNRAYGKKTFVRQNHYNHPVCVNCSKKNGKVIRLQMKKNGIFIPYGKDSAQAGDLLKCPICHFEIVQGFSNILSNSTSSIVLESEHAIF
jgi:hypothetical protein